MIGVFMLTVDCSDLGIVRANAGSEWTPDDTNTARGIALRHQGEILMLDISNATLGNGYTLALEALCCGWSSVVVVCGNVRKRAKMELAMRVAALPCPIVAVYDEAEAWQVVTSFQAVALSATAVH
jgi:hypothetical protein